MLGTVHCPLHNYTFHCPLHNYTVHCPLHNYIVHCPLHNYIVHCPLHNYTAHCPLHNYTVHCPLHNHCTQCSQEVDLLIWSLIQCHTFPPNFFPWSMWQQSGDNIKLFWFLSLCYNHKGISNKARIMPALKTSCMLNKHYIMDKLQHNGSGTEQTFEHTFLVDQKCCSKTINNLQRIPFQLFVGDKQTCHQALTTKAAFQFTKLTTDASTNGLRMTLVYLTGNSHCYSYSFTWQHMVRVKVKLSIEQATKVKRWSRGTALLFH
jgi:hypothetical protein